MTDRIDVFVSYKREERALARRVVRALRDAGYTAVTDLNIAKNTEFGDAIDTMIRTARLTLVLWTRASAASDWVRAEARLARDLNNAGKPNTYLGVMVEDVSLDLPPDLRGLQMVDVHATGLTDGALDAVMSAVRSPDMLGQPVQGAEGAEADSVDLSEEFQLYELARSIDTAQAYDRYLDRYPKGAFAKDARKQAAWARKWYLHPLRRGSLSNTIAAVSVAAAVGVGIWTANQPPPVIGVRQAEHDAVVAERDTAQGHVSDLTAELTETKAARDRAVQQADALQRSYDAASAAARVAERNLAKARADLDTAQGAAQSRDDEIADLQQRVAQLQDRAETAGADLDTARGELSRVRAERDSALAQVAQSMQEIAALEAQVEAAQSAPDAAPAPDCTTDGKRGIAILDRCVALDTTRLVLSETELSDLTPLAGLTDLQTLFVHGTQVSDLTPLAGLTELQTLHVARTQVSDLAPLAGLTELQILSVSNTQVRDLAPLAGLTELQTLYVNNTQVRDLAPLLDLPNLRWLSPPTGTQLTTRDDVTAYLARATR